MARGSPNTINVSTHYTADGLVQLVASIEDACTAKPVALSDSCSLSFECDGAAIPSATQSLAEKLQAVIGSGEAFSNMQLIKKSCICTCGTYCCILCTSAAELEGIPEWMQVEAPATKKRSVGSVKAKFTCT